MASTLRCTETDCPAVDTLHCLGDNECGYLNNAGTPKFKGPLETACRRPNCGLEFPTPKARLAHEKDATRHRKADMDFICDWNGHTDAIQDHNFCPVCQ